MHRFRNQIVRKPLSPSWPFDINVQKPRRHYAPTLRKRLHIPKIGTSEHIVCFISKLITTQCYTCCSRCLPPCPPLRLIDDVHNRSSPDCDMQPVYRHAKAFKGPPKNRDFFSLLITRTKKDLLHCRRGIENARQVRATIEPKIETTK